MSENSSSKWNQTLEFYEYLTAANPEMPAIPFEVMLGQAQHEVNKTAIVSLDLSQTLGTLYAATTPNCEAQFVYVLPNETCNTEANASSNLFVVLYGSGQTQTPYGTVEWSKGDVITIPHAKRIVHHADDTTMLYWVHDAPLLSYLNVCPKAQNFSPTHYPYERIQAEASRVDADPKSSKRNRNGVLLANPACPLTKTITPILWSLYNTIHPGQVQLPHRHNSVALDLCLSASEGVYTLMGPNLDESGQILNPIKADWVSNSMFVTPPGWWHSHHNESNQDAIVFPVQDAGLQTYMRTLDIQFAGGI